ncbi:hypothetical protein [Sorangium sp. So ce204]|uniref:hypothetical protein n=2 Tax=Sorangium TaxID=39643 RepID=UPI003F6427D7
MKMKIERSRNVGAENCEECRDREPWDKTIAAVARQLAAHGVTWPAFVIMHGHDRRCAEALGAENFDRSHYIVAVDEEGKKAKDASVFDRKDGSFVGVTSVINGSAFHRGRSSCERCSR